MIAIINAVASLAGTWMEGKVETQKAKVEVAKRVAAGEQEWNQTMASASASSWKDEWLTILVSIPLILAFTGHEDIVQRGFDALIDVFGADHGGYVKRMKAAVAAVSDNGVPLDVKLTQLVRLFKGGEPFKMSKRAGTFVMLRDVVDEVGADVTRFIMLTRKNDAPLDFDLDKVMEQSKDNPVFYVQYAHARIQSVLRKSVEAGMGSSGAPDDLTQLSDPAEFSLIAKLAEWPRMVEIAAQSNEPHRIAFYLYDLSAEFHALWNKGNGEPHLRFFQEDDAAATAAKLALIRAVAVVISNGLGILGVKPVKKM